MTCAACGREHAPIGAVAYYATQPGTPEHARELAWFERHGVIPRGAKPIEAFCLAHARPKG